MPFQNRSTLSSTIFSVSGSDMPGCRRPSVSLSCYSQGARTMVTSSTSNVLGLTVPNERWNKMAWIVPWRTSRHVERSTIYVPRSIDGQQWIQNAPANQVYRYRWIRVHPAQKKRGRVEEEAKNSDGGRKQSRSGGCATILRHI